MTNILSSEKKYTNIYNFCDFSYSLPCMGLIFNMLFLDPTGLCYRNWAAKYKISACKIIIIEKSTLFRFFIFKNFCSCCYFLMCLVFRQWVDPLALEIY